MEKIERFDGEHRVFSNFHPAKVKMFGVWFPTVEHAYVAAKNPTKEHIEKVSKLSSTEAGKVKKLGQTVKIRSDWEDVKVAVMVDLLEQKFQDPILKEKLLNTGEATLIEGNYWHDNFWGVCNCKKCEGVSPKRNILGILLMAIRTKLKQI